jgi:hypothetical protein
VSVFDDAEALSEQGTFWSPRNPERDHPAKLTLQLERWEDVPSKFDPEKVRPVFVGRDRDGNLWKVPCDNLDLKPVHSGDVKQWNDDRRVFEVVANWGRTAPGEVVVFEYRGDRSYTNRAGQEVTTASFRFTRPKPAGDAGSASGADPGGDGPPPIGDAEAAGIAAEVDDDIFG